MKKIRKTVCRLLVVCMLFTTCFAGNVFAAETKSGTWKQNKNGYWYEFSDGTYAKNQWLQVSGKWYHFNAGGYMQTGWLQIGDKWYFLDPKTGAMQTGWKTVSGKTYYFKASGEMAAAEYIQGYWLNKDGTWTYKAKASWKKNSKGWWYEDTEGWFAKSQWVKIDGKDYYFLSSGFMAVSRWIGKSYVGADGVWVPGKKSVDWPKLYQSFILDEGWLSFGKGYDFDEYTNAGLFDAENDGIPELLVGSYIFKCSSGKVTYSGEWPKNTSVKGISFLRPEELAKELPTYSGLISMENPVEWLGNVKEFLNEIKYADNYDFRNNEPFNINCLYEFDRYPTDPVIYSYRKDPTQEDPRGMFGTYYYKLNGTKIDWILKNVYNCSDLAISKEKQDVDPVSSLFPMYYQGGYYYSQPYYNFESSYAVTVKSIRTLNGLYIVEYTLNQYYMGELVGEKTKYAVLQEKTVSGKAFLSLYINSETMPYDSVVKSIKKVAPGKLP